MQLWNFPTRLKERVGSDRLPDAIYHVGQLMEVFDEMKPLRESSIPQLEAMSAGMYARRV